MLRSLSLLSALTSLALSGAVLAQGPTPTPAPEKRIVIKRVDGGASSTAPGSALSAVERARIEREIAGARERLQEAAQRVAELSMKLGQRDAYRFEFSTGATPRALLESRPVLGVVLDESGDDVGVRAVSPGGPAEQAGVRAGDTLFSVNGKRLLGGDDGVESAVAAIGPLKEGQKVAVTVVRDGAQRNLLISARKMAAHSSPLWAGDPDFDVDLDADFELDVDTEFDAIAPEAPRDLGDGARAHAADGNVHQRRQIIRRTVEHANGARAPYHRAMVFRSAGLGGLQLAPLNPELGRHFGAQSGVLVLDNKGSSFPELRTGDVITGVDGKPVAGHRELMRAMLGRGKGSRAILDVVRDRKPLSVSVATPTLRDVLVAPPAPPAPPVPPAPPTMRAPPAPPAPPPPPRGVSA